MADIPVLEPVKEEATASSGKGKWLTIIIAVVLVLAGASAGAWLGPLFSHSSQPTKKAVKKAEPAKGPALYAALDPPFVVNFEAEQLVRFLQVTVQVMSREPATLELLKANDPVVRNDLLLLFANQKYAVISTSEGKEKLRSSALEVVRKVVGGAGGKPESVEAIYFTSFVMQ
ncbi:MAG TPA: flagellar basal body-associated FliL family protein [Steroidobacteraceae bacterium]|jgi:flagellar FliL protein